MLVDLHSSGLVFANCADVSKLLVKDATEAADLSSVEEDTIEGEHGRTRELMDKLNLKGKIYPNLLYKNSDFYQIRNSTI